MVIRDRYGINGVRSATTTLASDVEYESLCPPFEAVLAEGRDVHRAGEHERLPSGTVVFGS
jgi:hypothetical protein